MPTNIESTGTFTTVRIHGGPGPLSSGPNLDGDNPGVAGPPPFMQEYCAHDSITVISSGRTPVLLGTRSRRFVGKSWYKMKECKAQQQWGGREEPEGAEDGTHVHVLYP